jgi:hypothetical protein
MANAAATSEETVSDSSMGAKTGSDFFYTAGYDGTVRSWDVINGRNIGMLPVYSNYLQRLSPSTAAPNSYKMPFGSTAANTTTPASSYEKDIIVEIAKPSFVFDSSLLGSANAYGRNSFTGVNASHLTHRSCLVTRNWYGGVKVFLQQPYQAQSNTIDDGVVGITDIDETPRGEGLQPEGTAGSTIAVGTTGLMTNINSKFRMFLSS